MRGVRIQMRSSLPSDDDKLEARRELMEEITEEQRQRAAANRIAAIAKRKAQDHGSWALFKCNKTSHQSTANKLAEKFCVRLEICSPDSFSLTPHPAKGFPYPGEDQCFRRLTLFLSNVMPSHYTQNHGGGKACVYKLGDYEAVSRCLKSFKSIEIEDVPFATLNVIERLSRCFAAGRWMPCRPEHFSDEKVEELMGRLPKTLLDALLPFQLDGIRYGLQRGGRCLIADEMGLGKTLQGIAIACCFMNEGSILVVCPAILRYSWAEELERWLPICLPADIHLVFGRRDNPAHLKRRPRVVVISYTMLCRLRKSMLEQEWALLIVDESHHVRTSKTSESEEIKAVLDVATKIKHIVLLSGTPSLSRPFDIFHQINMLWPGLLGKTKYEFAKTYCDVQQRNGHGNVFQDFSKGTRLEELNVLLKRTVMIRRLKENVLQELPPKRRQIIRLLLKRSDIVSAKAVAVGMKNAAQDTLETLDEPEYEECGACISSEKLSHQELGIAKLSGFREWISLHPLIALRDGAEELDLNSRSHKMIIFAHHLKVLDGVQEFLCEKEICFVRIDGNTLARDRQSAVQSFQSSSEVKIAIIGITAGGVGLDFSSAQHVVFLELPQSPSLMLQAEDRAHRRGQTNAVNIYIFCAKDTMDESHWTNLNKSLRCVSSATNGKYDSVQEIAVEGVSYLKTSGEIQKSCELSGGSTWLVHTGLGSSMQSFQLHNELTEKGNDISELGSKNGSLETKLGRIYEDLEVNSGRMSSNEQDIGSEDKDQLERDCNFYTHNREAGDGQLVQPIEADISFSDLANCLRFEVSQYTGRIHLYSCIPGKDSRPTPLFENFRPEEIESGSFPSVSDNQKATSLKDNPTCRHALLTFLKEWNQLRPIEARKLRGKPLQLPLNVELCYLKESSNHNNGGLLNGGSKRRTTPLCEISHSLPSNAVWKEVLIGRSNWKKEKQYTQAWSVIHDEPLCKLCHTPCEGNNARTPEFFEDLFCNLGCYEEYRIRTSNRFLRQELFQIEHGVCTNCQLDCHQLIKHLKPLSLERRLAYIERVAPKLASKKTVLDKLVNDPSGGNAWHADHIVPVYLGGGECRLENMRTLCVVCHSEVTAAQCSERRASRAEAKRRLKAIMTNLRNKEVMETSSKVINEGEGDEDELIVKVPGSAYCGEKSIMGG